MLVEGRTALITGANRGIGEAFAQELLRRGAAKVYAGARDPGSVASQEVVPLALDVTDPESVAAAAATAGDVTIVINNAGRLSSAPPLTASLEEAREQLEVNCLGSWAVAQAFAPVIIGNGGGALVHMLSVASWASSRSELVGYAASKAAQWAVTNALRIALRPQGVRVTGVHVGWVDTEMASGIADPKISPKDVARIALQGLAEDRDEVLVDERSKAVKASLSTDRPAYLPAP